MLQVNFDVHHLQLGTKIPDTAAIVPPDTVNYTHYDNDAWYALLMVGLDFPATKDKPYKAPYQHWAVGSIHEDQFLSGECLINYEWTAAPYKKVILRRQERTLIPQNSARSIVLVIPWQ
ncbi:unnamed protein product [Bemisia tabaci]|uniref:Uncharacterized protein n=1 Tax=Bemisia tabaci TaxID=7038 RepID=A0A9P0FZG7_BEMTA|nr:unnamed protein product [Bemisia tabaci]